MSVDKSTVVRIAQLAKIKVPEEDLKTLAEELSRIIEWVDQLNEVNTDGVEPMAHALDVTNALRPDEPSAGMAIVDVLANAPQKSPPFFQVPKVLGEGGNA